VNAQHIDNLPLLSTQTSESFKNWQVSLTRPVLFQTLPSTYPDAPIRSDTPRERVDQSRLADAGFSGNKYYLALTNEHLRKPASHPRQRFVASDNSLRRICDTQRRARNDSIAPDFLMVSQRLATLCDLTDEAIASTMCRFNEAGKLWIIAKSLAKLTNGDFEDGIADKRFWPDSVENFLLGDELAWTPKEIAEHGEGFGSELDCL
jgi:hypothetical protein